MGLLCVVLGVQHLPLGAALIWFGVSCVVPGVAYAGPGVNIFGKAQDGQIPLASKLLFFPYLALTALVWHLACRTSSEEPYDRVNEHLLIGRRLLPHELPDEVTHVIDLTTEFSEPPEIVRRTSYHHFPIMDAHVPEQAALAALLGRLPTDGLCYIHCAQGHGRTGTVALAWLATRGDICSVDEGLALLQSKRSRLRINGTQRRFVQAFLEQPCE